MVEARVTDARTWWRVRVGPFTSRHAAQAYRAQFEAKEHVVPFVVPPALRDGHEPAAPEELSNIAAARPDASLGRPQSTAVRVGRPP